MTRASAIAPRRQRIAGIDDADAPLWLRGLFALQRRIYDAVLEPTRVWARAPKAMLAFVQLFAAVDRASSPIEPALRSLVMAKVSYVNACAFCVDIHTRQLRRRRISMEKALAVSSHATSPLFSVRERAALDYAEAMAGGEGVDDETFERLREHFDDDAVVELTALVALQDASSKFNVALRIPTQGFCPGVRPVGAPQR